MVKNPASIQFTSPDHALLTDYQIDFVTAAGAVIQTLTVPVAQVTVLPTGEILIALNVQPVAFGTYTFVVRSVAGPDISENSEPSEPWQRVPGAPSQIVVK